MTTLDALIVDLLDALAIQSDVGDDGSAVAVTAADLDLPVESTLAADGRCLATIPRGRTATGFDPPLGRLVLRLEGTPW